MILSWTLLASILLKAVKEKSGHLPELGVEGISIDFKSFQARGTSYQKRLYHFNLA